MRNAQGNREWIRAAAAVFVVLGVGAAIVYTATGDAAASDVPVQAKLAVRPLAAAPADRTPDGLRLSQLPAVRWFKLTGVIPPTGGKPVDFEVLGSDGQRAEIGTVELGPDRRYLAVISSYDKPPANPRLRVVSGDKILLETPIADLPETKRILKPVMQRDARFQAQYVETPNRRIDQPPRAVRVTLARPPKKDEMAEVTVYRTSYFDGTRVGRHFIKEVMPAGARSVDIGVPNAEDTREMEIGVRYLSVKNAKDRITIPGPELVEIDGNAHVVNGSDLRIKTPHGFEVVFNKQRAMRREGVTGNRSVTMALWAANPSDPSALTNRNTLGQPAAKLQILSPKPEDLGLEKITAGPVVVRNSKPVKPIQAGPLKLVVEVEGPIARPGPVVKATIPVSQ